MDSRRRSAAPASANAETGRGVELVPGLPRAFSALEELDAAENDPPPAWILDGLFEAGDKALLIAPSRMLSMPSMAPAMEMNRVLTPQALVRASCCGSLNNFPAKCPTSPPATMALQLINVPRPSIPILRQTILLAHHTTE